MRTNKKAFGFVDFYSILLIILTLFVFFMAADLGAGGKSKIDAAGKASTGAISMINYARTPITIENTELDMADLLIAYHELYHSETSRQSKAFSALTTLYDDDERQDLIETQIISETNKMFKLLGEENVCYELYIGEDIQLSNNPSGCKEVSKTNLQIVDEKIYLPNPINKDELIEVWFEDHGWI